MERNLQDCYSILQQISDVLLINGGFLNNPGLYSGETGIVLFFVRYARFTQNDLYLDYAYGLVEKIQNRINHNTLINYEQGLTGIGSTIEYLVQNGFFEADTDEILEDFDKRVFFTYNLLYLPIDEVIDVSHYALWRLSGSNAHKGMILQTILPQIEKVLHNHSIDISQLQVARKSIPKVFLEKTSLRYQELIANNVFWNKEMGLYDGLAGWGMSLLTELDGDNSWFSLLPDCINITLSNGSLLV